MGNGWGNSGNCQTRIHTGLLADGPGHALRPAVCETRLKAQGLREDVGLPHFYESKNGMMT